MQTKLGLGARNRPGRMCFHVCVVLNVNMYMYNIYICICACVYVCTCVCVYVCMCICVYVCMYACMHVCMCVCVYVCKCIYGGSVYMHAAQSRLPTQAQAFRGLHVLRYKRGAVFTNTSAEHRNFLCVYRQGSLRWPEDLLLTSGTCESCPWSFANL